LSQSQVVYNLKYGFRYCSYQIWLVVS